MTNINDIIFKIYFKMNKPKDYAGLLLGFLAFFVDFIIISIFGNLILLFINNDLTRYIEDFDPISFLTNPIIIIINWLYFSILESNANFQATLGKKIFKLKVVNIHDRKITFGQASGRFFW